jgi:formiminotetrahydrofolate cyclodeaminase
MIEDQPIQRFLDELASGSPTPGGGGVAALMGAMGAALIGMVCHLTIGKKNYADVEEEMRATAAAAEELRGRLTELIRADAEVFDRVMAAYGLPKDTGERMQARAEAIQSTLKAATDVPLRCAKASAEVIELSRVVAERGNKNVVSDAGVAVLAAHAALKSAALNVYVNVGAITDETFVHERLSELNAILTGMEVATEAIHAEVQSRL